MKQNNDQRHSQYWERMHVKSRGMFSLIPLIAPLIIIAAVIAAYYYLILIQNFFPAWQLYIYWLIKFIIAFEILSAAARTIWSPILATLIAGGLLYAEKTFDLAYINMNDAWQLLIIAAIGYIVTFVVKL